MNDIDDPRNAPIKAALERERWEADEQLLAAIAEKMADRLDKINELFDAAEKRLRALRPIRDVGVEFTTDRDACTHILGLAKYEGKWRLMHASFGPDASAAAPQDLIINRSAEIRIAAAKHVRRLHEAIVFQREGFVEELDAAIAALTNTLKEMG